MNQGIAARDDVQLVPVVDLDDGAQRFAVFDLTNLAAQRRRWSGTGRRRRGRLTAALPARRHRLTAAALTLLRGVGARVLHGATRREEPGPAALFVQHAGV